MNKTLLENISASLQEVGKELNKEVDPDVLHIVTDNNDTIDSLLVNKLMNKVR